MNVIPPSRWGLGEGDEVTKELSQGLAVALAGQVSVGLTPGDGAEERMRGALIAIGLMVKGAAQDQIVDDILALPDGTRITSINGGWRIEPVSVNTPEGGDPEGYH